jgi:hypothetical protein
MHPINGSWKKAQAFRQGPASISVVGACLTAALSDVFEAKLVFSTNVARRPSPEGRRDRCRAMGVGNESNQVSKGYPVDALALRGDEGRGTLR